MLKFSTNAVFCLFVTVFLVACGGGASKSSNNNANNSGDNNNINTGDSSSSSLKIYPFQTGEIIYEVKQTPQKQIIRSKTPKSD